VAWLVLTAALAPSVARATLSDPAAPVLAATHTGATSAGGFAKRVARDLGPLVVTPSRWQGRNWSHFAEGLAVIATARVFDDRSRDAVMQQPGQSSPQWYPALRSFGQEGGLALLGASWIAGRATHRPEVVATAQDGLEAVILAAGVITPMLKLTTGRARPLKGEGPASLHPFGGDLSFPSGEVTEAFAIASVVSAHTDQRWLQGTVWTLAGAVGWERMRLDAHWASDVVAGALIGASVGHWVVHRHEPTAPAEARFDLLPLASREGYGLALHVTL
jgi:membrane-associated phospholipid phosphatase